MTKTKTKTKRATKDKCDHEPMVWAENQGSKIWICQCGRDQFVSGVQNGDVLAPLTGKQKITRPEGGYWPKDALAAHVEDVPPAPQPIPQLSSASNEHYSPIEVVEPARELMGGIDLDPATCHEANQVIRAHTFYTEQEDGLTRSWCWQHAGVPMRSKVFLNPPGGPLRIGKKPVSQAALWWTRLVLDWLSGDVEQAVFVGFTLEILRTSQGARLPVQRFHRCYPRDRLVFSGKEQPTHANVIVYLPPTKLDGGPNHQLWFESFRKFERAYGSLGFCEPGWDPSTPP